MFATNIEDDMFAVTYPTQLDIMAVRFCQYKV